MQSCPTRLDTSFRDAKGEGPTQRQKTEQRDQRQRARRIRERLLRYRYRNFRLRRRRSNYLGQLYFFSGWRDGH